LNNFFDPGDAGNNFFRNFGTLLPAAMTSHPANSNHHRRRRHHHHHHQQHRRENFRLSILSH